MADVNSLADVIEAAMQKHAVKSGRALEGRSKEIKHPISYTTINQLRNGTYHHDLARDLREALHHLSGVPLRVIDRLAGVASATPFELPESADTLLGDQREAVLAVVRAFVNANAQHSTSTEEGQEDASAIDLSNRRRAARKRRPNGPTGGKSTKPKGK